MFTKIYTLRHFHKDHQKFYDLWRAFGVIKCFSKNSFSFENWLLIFFHINRHISAFKIGGQCTSCQIFNLFEIPILRLERLFNQIVHAFLILPTVVIAVVIISIIMNHYTTTCPRWNIFSIALYIDHERRLIRNISRIFVFSKFSGKGIYKFLRNGNESWNNKIIRSWVQLRKINLNWVHNNMSIIPIRD